ncbi:MAG: GAF domain-containing protein [Bacteroidales bacterium]|nr:GAF domain-containing protein [Bacteroidales bacterium]
MSEQLIVKGETKHELYSNLLPQIKSLVENEPDAIANMANVAACLKATFNFWWVGFYRVIGDELVLGPFQGPVACTRIRKGRGVCGTSWQEGKTVIVPDVDKFPGHIACSSLSKSEIVVPLFVENEVVAVLDIDSEKLACFDDEDRLWLEEIAGLLCHETLFNQNRNQNQNCWRG